MSRKINLILAAFLLGGIASILPNLFKLCLFVGVGLVLFMKYDDFDYEQRAGGNHND